MKQKSQRRAEVAIRNEAHNKLSTLDKIEKAKSRRGNSKRELARLTAKLESEAQVIENKPTKKKKRNDN